MNKFILSSWRPDLLDAGYESGGHFVPQEEPDAPRPFENSRDFGVPMSNCMIELS